MVVPPSAVMSLFEWCTKKMFKQSKVHTAFLRTWSFVNTTFHMVSGIVHQEVLPSCLFHVWQGQRVSSSASLLDDGLMHPKRRVIPYQIPCHDGCFGAPST